MKNKHNRLSTTATIANGMELGLTIIRGVAGSTLDGNRMGNLESMFAIQLKNELAKKGEADVK